MLNPWDEAGEHSPLRRSWCHAALHVTLQTETKLAIQTTAFEEARLKNAVMTDMTAAMKLLDTRADGWKKDAEAPTEEEHALVERLVEGSPGGYEAFSQKLADTLHKWLLGRAKATLDDLPAGERGRSDLIDKARVLL